MARKWETPRILAVDGLPKTLGDCVGGSTDTTTTQGDCGCHNGENTLGNHTVQAAGTPANGASSHGCSTGGVPSGCFCGTTATFPD